MHQYTFTVFTATYNRVKTLPRVYNSLKDQTYRDFEWLIVDDGSTDGTRELVEAWQKEADFPIRYYWQENQCKHIAFNRGVKAAKGALFLNLDSDDSCVPEALERLKYHWDSIPEQEKEQFSAVTVLCVYQNGKLVGTKYPKDIFDSNPLAIRYKYKVKGDKWGFQCTDILRKYPFPENLMRTYVPENIIWNAIARKYKSRFVNEMLRIYWADDSPKSDQISKSARAYRAVGCSLYYGQMLNHDIRWFFTAPTAFIKAGIQYCRYSFHAGYSIRRQVNKLENVLSKLLWAISLPAGYLLYLNDKV